MMLIVVGVIVGVLLIAAFAAWFLELSKYP